MFREGRPTSHKMVGAMLALGSLLKLKNVKTAAFTKVVGVSMFYTGTERRMFIFVNHTGLCCSYDTVIDLLDKRASSIDTVCLFVVVIVVVKLSSHNRL